MVWLVRAKSRRSRLWVLVVLVLFLLMGYATEGPLQLPEWDPEEAGDGLAWSNILVWIFIGLALLAYVGFLWIIMTSPIYEDEDEKYEDPKRLPWQVVAFLGVMFAGFAALIAWLRKNLRSPCLPRALRAWVRDFLEDCPAVEVVTWRRWFPGKWSATRCRRSCCGSWALWLD